ARGCAQGSPGFDAERQPMARSSLLGGVHTSGRVEGIAMSLRLRNRIWPGIALCLSFLVLLVQPITATTPCCLKPWIPQPSHAYSNIVQTADDVRWLEPGKSIERWLAGGETHSYRLTLAAGQFSHMVVNQRGIDLVVAFYGLDGGKLVEIDNPNDVN